MAATFVVEDGSGLATANAYVSVAAAIQYHENHGDPVAWSGASTAAQQAAIRDATRAIDARYGSRWKGRRVKEAQALDWPRFHVFVDRDGWAIDSDVVPVQVEEAASIMALASIGGEDLVPDVAAGGNIKSESGGVGTLRESIEYTGGGKSTAKRYTLADKILSELVGSRGLVRG